ncbi:MAG: hypothetical protein IKT52_00370 [Oscillospiraceae bacterium]|nr:hypothetical protein [Oscillospiraceae bacterium]
MNVNMVCAGDCTDQVGAEAAIAAMDEYSRAEIGRKTYRFVRRCMQDPALREKIKKRAAELRAANTTDEVCNGTKIES